MFIIGEKINATRKSIDAALRSRDASYLQEVAKAQEEAGAHALDVNCGTFTAAEEPEVMKWLVETVQATTELPLCIDSPNPGALAAGLARHKGKPVINSISGESARYDNVLPLVKQYNAAVVALCNDDRGLPSTKEMALEVGDSLVSRLVKDSVPIDDIYLDPLVRTLATSPETVVDTLEVMRELSHCFPGLHFVSGLSNVSYGLPERRFLNRAFVVMSIAYGLDAVIVDPLDKQLVAMIYASEALLSKDRYCLEYIKAFHNGKLKD
ncbi:MAG: methyltetrahydrofolate cobalamin methyltransferase [Desulfomonile tiedjei]|uniref:Methyltetrahydrofolate cobalamin methyltransferase n=1 Tax=Desulfomonile tiedjei TaxID=2358 RepID=A0A9D6UZN8_9BACT|nr:methyltetrahydrofolate cobalamin methyltransferase [Desulfomonile tiedjei]